jgi:hypothetical protein
VLQLELQELGECAVTALRRRKMPIDRGEREKEDAEIVLVRKDFRGEGDGQLRLATLLRGRYVALEFHDVVTHLHALALRHEDGRMVDDADHAALYARFLAKLANRRVNLHFAGFDVTLGKEPFVLATARPDHQHLQRAVMDAEGNGTCLADDGTFNALLPDDPWRLDDTRHVAAAGDIMLRRRRALQHRQVEVLLARDLDRALVARVGVPHHAARRIVP